MLPAQPIPTPPHRSRARSWLIDDIRETVATCCRARDRTGRLTHRRANVWSFLAAPRHLVAT
eukprot:6911205-Prymnesium_polylepis.2